MNKASSVLRLEVGPDAMVDKKELMNECKTHTITLSASSPSFLSRGSHHCLLDLAHAHHLNT